jgi:putative glutamine amidotransferase
MHAKPLIGVNVDCLPSRLPRRGFSDPLLPRWLDGVARGGGIPILIPPMRDTADVDRVLAILDGFVWAADMPPGSRQDEQTDSVLVPEIELVRRIATRHLAFLGIGAGMQLLNVALGGTLVSLAERTGGRAPHVHAHHPRHTLGTSRGSVMERVFGSRTDPVDSTHTMAVDELAVGLRATAWSDDGVIEAVENETREWFALGIQFLPDADLLRGTDVRLFAALVEEANAARARNPESQGAGHRASPPAGSNVGLPKRPR